MTEDSVKDSVLNRDKSSTYDMLDSRLGEMVRYTHLECSNAALCQPPSVIALPLSFEIVT